MSIAVPTNTATSPNPEATDARASAAVDVLVEFAGPSGPPAVNPGTGSRRTGAPTPPVVGALSFPDYCELQR